MRFRILSLLVLWTANLFAGDIFVFAPTLTKSNVIEKGLEGHLNGHVPKVFGRYSDFKVMVSNQKPIAVLAPLATLRELGIAEKVRLQGTVKGQAAQPLVLVSLGVPMDSEKLKNASVGLVSIMERQSLKRYLEKQLSKGVRPNPTTKLEDLLPLLTFQSAKAILVTDAQALQIRSRSQADLVVRPVPGAFQDCLALAILDESGLLLLSEIEKWPRSVLELLDLEGWKK